MRDKIVKGLGGYKEYAMEMVSSFIGMSISKVLLHNPYDQDEDIKSIMEYFAVYDLSEHYEDPISRASSYYYFKYYNLPTTIKIIKNAVKQEKLEQKWMPCLKVFFEKTKEFLDEVPTNLDDYIKSLDQYK